MSITGPIYFRGANPIWYFVDLTGMQFDDTFYLWVLNNDVPYYPAPVYQTPTGTPWTDPIQCLANGTFPENMYFDPNIVYRLEFRQNLGLLPPSQSDPLIYLVENYYPSGVAVEPSDDGGDFTTNQITNPQFAFTNFQTPYSQTLTNQSLEIAPGWFIDVTGSGTLGLQQIALNNATSNPTNAPYALRITSTGGFTNSIVLRQRFSVNGMLWANKYVSSSFTALCNGAPISILGRLDANGTPVEVLFNPTLNGVFTQYTNTVLMPATVNANLPPNAYVDFKIFLPTTCDVYLTSLQLIASDENVTVNFQQDTVNRELDHTFNYWLENLIYKPIPSYLVGWDFPLNPAQFATSGGAFSGTNVSNYVWDQTIVFQTAATSFNFAPAADGSLQLTTTAAGQLAVIQYLDGDQVNDLLQNPSSVMLSMLSDSAINGTVTLWACTDTNLPTITSSIVATLDANGFPATVNGTWFQIPTLTGQNMTINLAAQSLTAPYQQFPLTWWTGLPTLVGTAKFFAIVVGFGALPNPANIIMNKIGCSLGYVATLPAPKTAQQTLSDCEFFWEQSYTSGIAAGTVATTNDVLVTQGVIITPNPTPTATYFMQGGFSVDYQTIKRTSTPTIKFYSPRNGGSAGLVDCYIKAYGGNIDDALGVAFATYWNLLSSGNKRTNYVTKNPGTLALIPANSSNPNGGTGWLSYHYTCDARLGVVN